MRWFSAGLWVLAFGLAACDGLTGGVATPVESCTNAIDDDEDGLVDCDDDDCLGKCPESCVDQRDNDGDELVDCADPDCDGQCAEVCDDGRDNDGDNATDCADLDCFGSCPEDCDDGRDNDGDGAIDCTDVDCTDVCPEDCFDGLDNDGDSDADCDDAECGPVCDADSDGHWNIEVGGTDCNDDDPTAYPGAPEVCDGVDNDCDTLTDDADDNVDTTTFLTWYGDADGDGYGRLGPSVDACAGPSGWVADATDCDDTNDAVNPGASEVCNGIDDECDDLIDDDDPTVDPDSQSTWHADTDGDGYGDPTDTLLACDPPSGYVDDDLDCDDADPWTYDGAAELCDGADNDCNGPVDDDVQTLTWYLDSDGDGYGDPAAWVDDCDVPPGGYVLVADDCDDTDATRYPGAPEVCDDELDRNCDEYVEPCSRPSCLDYLEAGLSTGDGVYELDPEGDGSYVDVWCDMTGGGWSLVFLKNSVHPDPIFENAGPKFGVDRQDAVYLAADPAPYSSGSEVRAVAAWIDINRFDWTHLRLSSYQLGAHTYTSDSIARSELNIDFGNNGYYLWDAPADPPRADAQTYYWCGGDADYTDLGIGHVDPPVGAPSDCKGHGSLGSGWDFALSNSYNQGFTLCGGDASIWMYADWGTALYNYPTPGAAQAIWVR